MRARALLWVLLISFMIAAMRSLPAAAEPLPPGVAEQLGRFTHSQAGFTQRSLSRAQVYLPMIRAELRRHGLPDQLAWIPLTESGFRPGARSPAGAVGLWQLMPQTARRFGLRVDTARDERLDPLLSTRAAAAYLAFLAQEFRSWPLVLAAYNAGEGRIGRLLAASRVRDFWALAETGRLPEETRQYVPSVIALSMICERQQRSQR